MSVKVQKVSKLYGGQKALDEVSFQVNQGEVMALLGPNGAGKSTMMKIISCYIPQSSGQAWVYGFNVVSHPLEVRRLVGYLPENNPLYPDMYVKEYLEFVASLYKLGKKSNARIQEMIEITGLTNEYRKKIGTLSKGYRQRVGLAQALIHDPQVLILDEPTSGLDPNQLVEIRNLIKTIGKQKTVLLSTHIMQEVVAMCDRVIIIDRGIIKADAPTAEIPLLNRANQVIKVGFDRHPDLDALKKMPGVVEVIEEDENNYRIFTDGEKDLRPVVFHFAVEAGLVILSMDHEVQSLEQIFRQLTS
ncbi:MAG: gliding motility-associated ABC transporter ATP-binding subunit GldA [Bacteroidales bacterium]